MSVTQIQSEAQFGNGWWLDWGNNYTPPGTPALNCPAPGNIAQNRNNKAVGRMDDVKIELQQTTVWVYSIPCRLEYCGRGTVFCNACIDDGLLVAPSVGESRPTMAAIRISFSKPISAVGSHVRALWRQGSQNAQFEARMWVWLGTGTPGKAVWRQPFTQNGGVGQPLQVGAQRGAPFLGAESSQRDIVGVAFDIAPIGQAFLPEVAITHLLARS
jgi:hypothetical protein